jgi:hypothetical protein
MSKLGRLAELEGYNHPFSMLEDAITDSVCPGICINKGCDYTTEVEPDCQDGYCEECETQTVKSAMILAGVV